MIGCRVRWHGKRRGGYGDAQGPVETVVVLHCAECKRITQGDGDIPLCVTCVHRWVLLSQCPEAHRLANNDGKQPTKLRRLPYNAVADCANLVIAQKS